MTTDGGGWTLIGRGRENWNWNDSGKNNLDVHTGIGTPAGFNPAYFSNSTIDQILNGTNVNSLTDGVRIKRVAPTAISGNTYQ